MLLAIDLLSALYTISFVLVLVANIYSNQRGLK